MAVSLITTYLDRMVCQLQKDHNTMMDYYRRQKSTTSKRQSLPNYDMRHMYDVIGQVTSSIQQHETMVAQYCSAEECCVCYERVADVSLPCSHRFCSVRHLRLNQCPLCRMPCRRTHRYLSDDDFSVDGDAAVVDNGVGDDDEYSSDYNEEHWWYCLNTCTEHMVRNVVERLGTDCRASATTINFHFNHDVFSKEDGVIHCDMEYLHDDANYQRFPVSSERRAILKERFCQVAPVLISKCRHWERHGVEIELKPMIDFRGY